MAEPAPVLWIMPGAHKTGTTTVQNILQKNVEYLEASGIKYINRDQFYASPLRQFLQQDIYYSGSSVKEQSARASLATLGDYTKQKFHTTILFVENLFGEPLYGMWSKPRPTPCLYPGFKIGLEKLAALAAPLFRMKAMFFFRRQDAFLSSLYSECIANGWDMPPQRFLCSLIGCDLSWARLIDSLRTNAGLEAVEAMPFELIHNGKDKFVGEILSRIGLSGGIDRWNLQVYEHRSLKRDAINVAITAFPFLQTEFRSEFASILRQIGHHFMADETFDLLEFAAKQELISRFKLENLALLEFARCHDSDIVSYYEGN